MESTSQNPDLLVPTFEIASNPQIKLSNIVVDGYTIKNGKKKIEIDDPIKSRFEILDIR